jgi:hypothetical protein
MKKITYLLSLSVSVFLLILAGCSKTTAPAPAITPPTITAISPVSGTVNTQVTITGTDFGASAADNTVKFNGVAATISSATTTSLVVSAPSGASTGPVTVSTASGTANGPTFTYIAVTPPAPTITAITPISGSAGITDTITGTNFNAIAANDTILFNGVAATVQTATATMLTVQVPATGTTGAVTITTSGGKATGPVFSYTSTDLYLAGQSGVGWGYWKNGVFTQMPADCSNVTSIFVSGTDVYIGGVDNTYLPKYWKNGVGVSVPVTTGHNEGTVRGMYVSGTDVYAGGDDNGNGAFEVPRIWKNGSPMPITFQYGGDIWAVAGSGTDVYAAGYQWSETLGGNGIATYWKNGIPTALTDGTNNAIAYSITVVGSDVYAAGIDGGVATYWKNGVAMPLSVPDPAYEAWGRSIYVTGTDVYVSGEYRDLAKYWKNGVMTDLSQTAPGGTNYESAAAITGKGTDIYIAGSMVSQGYGYWKNGVFQRIIGASYIGPIFVK